MMLALAFLNAVGLTLAISWSKIFSGFRDWIDMWKASQKIDINSGDVINPKKVWVFIHNLISCPFCLGFYVTTLMLVLHWIDPMITYFLSGFSGSVFCYIIYKRFFQ